MLPIGPSDGHQDSEKFGGTRRRSGLYAAPRSGSRLERPLLDRPGMLFERMTFVSGLVAILAASGCGSVLLAPNPDGGNDAGQDGSLAPAASSARRRAGRAATAPSAPVPSAAAGRPSSAVTTPRPSRGRSAPASRVRPPVRSSTRRRAGPARTAASTRAPTATAAAVSSNALPPNDPPIGCPAILCPAPCAQVTTKDACEARRLSLVFVDDRACGCAARSAAARFSRCADGGSAVCKPPAILCDAVAPHCEGPYVISYTASCYEGCVQSTDCMAN